MTRQVMCAVLIVQVLSCSSVPTGSEGIARHREVVARARVLSQKADYLGSLEALAAAPKTPEAILLAWRNDREIAGRSGPPSHDPQHPDHKYFLYAEQHPDRFEYQEAFGGELSLTPFHLNEIETLAPPSVEAGTIRYELTRDEDALISEGGLNDEDRVTLIQRYQVFLVRYPTHTYAPDAARRIRELESLKIL